MVIISYISSLPLPVFLLKQHDYRIPYTLDFPHVHCPPHPSSISFSIRFAFHSRLSKGFALAILLLSPGSPFLFLQCKSNCSFSVVLNLLNHNYICSNLVSFLSQGFKNYPYSNDSQLYSDRQPEVFPWSSNSQYKII